MNNLSMKKISQAILRVGIALVIIWFGIQQLSSPTDWLAYLPQWTTTLPISQLSLIYINGWFELVAGIVLFFGIYTRAIALLITLHLADITYTVGYGAIGVRDFGLCIAMLAIFFNGMSPVSIDMFFQNEDDMNRSAVLAPQPILPTQTRQSYFDELAKKTPSTNPDKKVVQ